MTSAPYTVTELTNLVVETLATRPELEDVLVKGEISNLTRPSSGHVYFTLKDRAAQLSCVCFRANALRVPFAPENGMTVVAHGQVGVYNQQGRYQLVVDGLEPSGVGALALAVEQRKRALAAEGLFDSRDKRPLPLLPRRVAVVTSRSGAALHDVVTVMGRRAPCVDIVFSPATVQGDGAADTIVGALRRAGRVRGVEVVLLVRGGGSLEDLMSFNDERVARAIRACPVPVVCGVGHETDLTIADLAADHRAPTPSAAAETAVPSCGQLRGELSAREHRLVSALGTRLAQQRDAASRRLTRLDQLSPVTRVARMRQEGRARDVRLRGALLATVGRRQRELERVRGALELHSPLRGLPIHRERLETRRRRLESEMRGVIRMRARHVHGVRGRLEALSPLRVMDRGYSITVDAATGLVITDASPIAAGAQLRTRLARGTLLSQVLPDGVVPPQDAERLYDAMPDSSHTSEDHDG